MANNYGYMAKIGLKDDGLEKSLAEINLALKDVERSISATDKAITNTGKAGLDTTQLWEQQYDLLRTQIETTTEKLTALESVQKKVSEAYDNGAIDYSAYVKFQNEVANTAAELERLKARAEQAHTAMSSPLISETTYQTIQASTTLERVNSRLEKTVSELNEVDKVMKKSGQSEELLAQKSQLLGEAIHAAQVKLTALTHEQERMNNAVKEGMTSEEEYRAFQREIAATTAELERLTKEQENLGKETEDTAESCLTLGDIIKSNIVSDLITKGIDKLTDAFSKLGNELQNIVVQTAAYGDAVDKQSQRLGMSEKAYQEWTYILSQNGADISSLTTAMRTLTNAVDNAQNGASAAINAFKKLGISVRDLKGLDGEQQFSLVVSRLQEMENETERNAVANDILGRSYQTLIPLLNQDADTVESLRQKANETNQILNEDGVDAAVNYTDAIDTLNKSIDGFKHNLGAEVLPVITELIEEITKIINETEKEDIEKLLNSISDAAKGLAASIKEFIDNDGIDKIIDVLQWIVDNGDKLVKILIALGKAWAVDKVLKFGKSLKDLQPKISMAISAVNAFGNAVNAAAGSTVAMSLSLSGWLAIAALAVTAATAIKDSIENAREALGQHSDTVNELDEAYEDINDKLTEFIELKERSLELAEEEARKNLDNAKAEAQSYKSRIDTLEKLLQKNREYYGTNNLEGKELFNFDYSGNVVGSAGYYSDISDELGSLYHDYYAANDLVKEFTNAIGESESAVKNASDNASRYAGAAEEAAANAAKNIGKTTSDVAKEIIEANVDKPLQAEVDKLDHKLKTHKITEEQYYAELKKVLDDTDSALKSESELWYSYLEKYNDFLDKKNQKDEEDRKKQEDEYKKKKDEEEKKKEDEIKKLHHDAEIKRLNGEYSDNELENEEKYFDQIEKLMEEFSDKESSLYLQYEKEVANGRKSIREQRKKQDEEDIKASQESFDDWQKNSEKTVEDIRKKNEEVIKEFESQKDSYVNAFDFSDKIKTADGSEKLVINDFGEQTKKLKKYQENVKKLKDTNISEEHFQRIMAMPFDERFEYISEILKMSDKNRMKYYSDFEAYIAEAENAARYDIQDELDDANKTAAEGVMDIFATMPDNAYDMGKNTALSYLEGINDIFGNTNNVLAGITTDNASINYSNAANAEAAVNAMGGTFSAADREIVINLDGKEMFRVVLDKYINDKNYAGGMLGG